MHIFTVVLCWIYADMNICASILQVVLIEFHVTDGLV